MLFLVDEQTYALQIGEVERIVRAVEVKPLPESPPHVRGIVNVQGRVLPVVDLRLRFGQPSRDIRLEDHFIIARTPTISVILPVDAALGSAEVLGRVGPARPRSGGPLPAQGRAPSIWASSTRWISSEWCSATNPPTDSDLASVLAELQTA